MDIRSAYESWSAAYDNDLNLTRDLSHAVTRAVLSKLSYKKILEIGCGTGAITTLLSQISESLLAIDFSPAMLRQAKTKLSPEQVCFALADLTKVWPCKNGFADLIVCNLVIEHLADVSFVFSEAARVLTARGEFFVCELHPLRQYQGTQARFQKGSETVEIPAFVHHVSDFLDAAENNGLSLVRFQEWWHEEDQDKLPRLVSFLFRKGPEQRDHRPGVSLSTSAARCGSVPRQATGGKWMRSPL